jgi:hypothetical protein
LKDFCGSIRFRARSCRRALPSSREDVASDARAGACGEIALICGEVGAARASWRLEREIWDLSMASGKKSETDARPTAPPPFSRPVAVASVPAEGLDLVLRPNDAERAALAQENGLCALDALEARLHLSRIGAEGLAVSGVVRAQVRQTCVVTLDEFDSVVEESVRLRFAPETPASGRDAKRGAEIEAALDDPFSLDDDSPDLLVGGMVDLGAVASEFLALGLDPYPRSPGAHFEEPAPATSEDGPFAALRARVDPEGGKGEG